MHAKNVASPTPPAPAPPPPTIDAAVQSTRQNDILRQRKGAAASMLAGANPQSPMIGGAATLLGA